MADTVIAAQLFDVPPRVARFRAAVLACDAEVLCLPGPQALREAWTAFHTEAMAYIARGMSPVDPPPDPAGESAIGVTRRAA